MQKTRLHAQWPQQVALVHDWLVAQRGGENVLLELARLFPKAPIYTLVHKPGSVHPEIESHTIHTTFINQLPGSTRQFRWYLPLFFAAIETHDLTAYDLVISTSHCVAKGVRTGAHQVHVSYVHTPMRYAWNELSQYLSTWPPALLKLAHMATWPLRHFDTQQAQRANLLLANSRHVAKRIEQSWGRYAEVLHPPVDVDFYAAKKTKTTRHGYLVVSALTPYKRVDLAVQVATHYHLPLTIVGQGPELGRLQRSAGPSVVFVASLPATDLREQYGKARALLFCGVEDFGIVPVEAMAAGCPVVGLAAGGLLETVRGDSQEATGVFFHQQTPEALYQAILQLETQYQQGMFQQTTLLKQAHLFHKAQFTQKLQAILALQAPLVKT